MLSGDIIRTDYHIEKQLIEYNDMRFYFDAFSGNDDLKNIQLYLIESELIQAVGRARPLRQQSWVHAFSSFPLYDALQTDLLNRDDLILFNQISGRRRSAIYINDIRRRDSDLLVAQVNGNLTHEQETADNSEDDWLDDFI